jgi:serine/threonine-protein kinase
VTNPPKESTNVVQLTPGETLDERWRLEARIGQGAMGSVFRGRDLKSPRVVAVKLLSPEHCRKPKVLARFEREAEKMVHLRHPNIIQFYAHGRRGAVPYIVMEYLEGMTLFDVIKHEGGSLKLPAALAVVKQLAAGLAFLHHNGLVHRDVKPQNIFMRVGGTVTILDLGVVHDQHNPGLTKPGAMVGTPYYMSPEQIQGLEDIDKRTDVYALAAMTFELLTGMPPFLGANNFEVLYGHRNLPPPDASERVKSISKNVAKVLIRGLAKRRDERPQTATEFVADFEAAAGHLPIDLAKTFAFVGVADSKASHEQTRLVLRPIPNGGPQNSMAASADVVSVRELDATRETSQPRQRERPRPERQRPQAAPILEAPPRKPRASDLLIPKPPRRPTTAPRLPAAKSPTPEPTNVIALGEEEDSATDQFPVLRKEERTRVDSQPDLTQSIPLPVDALRAEGQLRIIVTSRGRAARAQVSVEGRPLGSTPLITNLPQGKYPVRVELAGRKPSTQTVEIRADETLTVRVAFGRRQSLDGRSG